MILAIPDFIALDRANMPVCSLYIAVRAQASDNRHSLRPRAMNKHKSSGAASPNPEYAARKESPSFSNRNLVSGATLLFWRQFWRHFWHQCCFCPPGANFGVSFGVIFGANFGAKIGAGFILTDAVLMDLFHLCSLFRLAAYQSIHF